MRRSVMTVGVLGMFAAGLAFAQGGARTLFDGKSLDAWDRVGDANWMLMGGTVHANGGKGGYLVSKESFGDFELTVEFMVDTPATNSGVFIRCQDPKSIGSKTCYEVNIWDGRPEPDFATGGIVNVAKVMAPVKAAGQWGTMVITARGPRLTVTVNGTKTAEGEHTQHARGPIALQYGTGSVMFRKVQIRPL